MTNVTLPAQAHPRSSTQKPAQYVNTDCGSVLSYPCQLSISAVSVAKLRTL